VCFYVVRPGPKNPTKHLLAAEGIQDWGHWDAVADPEGCVDADAAWMRTHRIPFCLNLFVTLTNKRNANEDQKMLISDAFFKIKMCQNAFAAAPLSTPLGSLQRSPDSLTGFTGE